MLTDVYNGVSAACQAASTGIQAGGVPSSFGAEFIMANVAAPIWMWVPVHDNPGPPTNGDTMPSQDGNIAPPMFSRNALVDIHCWGADGTVTTDPLIPYANAEALFLILSQQINAWCSPMSFKYEGGEFEQVKEFTRAGRVYISRWTFRLPVTYPALESATVTKYPLTGVMTIPTV